MNRYFIETSVIIDYLRGKSTVVKIIEELEEELSSSYISMAELYEGINRVSQREKIEKAVIDFFKGLSKIYGVDEEIAKKFGEIRAELKKKGEVVEDLDILLAATCIANNFIMVTSNAKHFKRVPDLKVLGVNA